MTTTLTLKNIPESVYQDLKASAQLNRRSLNSEAIVCLETALMASITNRSDQFLRVQHLRETLRAQINTPITAQDIDDFKNQGRP